jgi:succinate-semialdehyde dehydrogenase/glutarate-semialdehyde dehydrogenase
LISLDGLAKVEELVADALAKGATALTGGCRHPLGGTYYEPTVLIDVPPDARIMQEEIFGPVAPLIRFDTEEEAIALANASEYGLASYFYATDLGRVFRVARAIQAGIIGVNDRIDTRSAFRRCQAIWHWPGGLAVRNRRIFRAQICVPRRDQPSGN